MFLLLHSWRSFCVRDCWCVFVFLGLLLLIHIQILLIGGCLRFCWSCVPLPGGRYFDPTKSQERSWQNRDIGWQSWFDRHWPGDSLTGFTNARDAMVLAILSNVSVLPIMGSNKICVNKFSQPLGRFTRTGCEQRWAEAFVFCSCWGPCFYQWCLHASTSCTPINWLKSYGFPRVHMNGQPHSIGNY